MKLLHKNIQWFPGHMAKTIRQLSEKSHQIDCIIEVTDARIPQSSRNPILSEIFPKHPRLLLLNKADLADPIITKKWIQKLQSPTQMIKATNSLDPLSTKTILSNAKKLITPHPPTIHLLIAGIPNVGKSTLINRLVGRRKTIVGNKPGVTKFNQWFSINENFKLLDSPGILWPKFEDTETGLNLAICQGIKESILDLDELAYHALEKLQKHYPSALKKRYQLDQIPEESTDVFHEIAKKRGFLIRGGEYDEDRTYKNFLMDLQSGKLGLLSFEHPD